MLRPELGFVQKTFAFCEARRAAFAAGNPPRRTRVKNYARHAAQRAALADLRLGRITIREFLETTCQLMTRVLQPVWEIVEDVPEAANEVVLGDEAEQELLIEVPAAQVEVPVVVEVEVPAAGGLAPAPVAPPTPGVVPNPVQAVVPAAAVPELDRVGVCGICTENLSNRVLVPCGHSLCADCLRSLEQARGRDVNDNVTSCPFCRAWYDRAINLFL